MIKLIASSLVVPVMFSDTLASYSVSNEWSFAACKISMLHCIARFQIVGVEQFAGVEHRPAAAVTHHRDHAIASAVDLPCDDFTAIAPCRTYRTGIALWPAFAALAFLADRP